MSTVGPAAFAPVRHLVEEDGLYPPLAASMLMHGDFSTFATNYTMFLPGGTPCVQSADPTGDGTAQPTAIKEPCSVEFPNFLSCCAQMVLMADNGGQFALAKATASQSDDWTMALPIPK